MYIIRYLIIIKIAEEPYKEIPFPIPIFWADQNHIWNVAFVIRIRECHWWIVEFFLHSRKWFRWRLCLSKCGKHSVLAFGQSTRFVIPSFFFYFFQVLSLLFYSSCTFRRIPRPNWWRQNSVAPAPTTTTMSLSLGQVESSRVGRSYAWTRSGEYRICPITVIRDCHLRHWTLPWVWARGLYLLSNF